MKAIVFAYHDIGCVGLKALVEAGYDIQAVFTHTDSPNENRFFSSVARVAADLELPVFAPEDVNHPLWIERIQQMQPDIIFSFYYRNMICDEILSSAPRGGFNLHGSLLPKYRGRAPINWALVNGEKETGVTLHKMVKKADAGPIAGQHKVIISDADTALTLHAKMRDAAQELLRDLLPKMNNASLHLVPQKEADASYFGRRTAADGEIHWQKSASAINNLVRAVTEPYPGALSLTQVLSVTLGSASSLSGVHDHWISHTGRLLVLCYRPLHWLLLVVKGRWRLLPGRVMPAYMFRAAVWHKIWALSLMSV